MMNAPLARSLWGLLGRCGAVFARFFEFGKFLGGDLAVGVAQFHKDIHARAGRGALQFAEDILHALRLHDAIVKAAGFFMAARFGDGHELRAQADADEFDELRRFRLGQ